MTKKLLALFSILLFMGACDEIDNESTIEDVIQEEVAAETVVDEEEENDDDEEERLQRKAELAEQREAVKEVEQWIEIVKSEPTQENYDTTLDLVNNLPRKNTHLENRVLDLELIVNNYEQILTDITDAVEKAEEDKTRESYEVARKSLSDLEIQNDDLEDRLTSLDQEITVAEDKIEKARLDQEEADRKTAEEKQNQGNSGGGGEDSSSGSESNGESSSGDSSNDGNSSDSGSSETPAPSQTPQPGEYVDANGQGTIKGSVNDIYHVPGSTYYSRTKNVVQWFKTIEEAEAAGYRAPER